MSETYSGIQDQEGSLADAVSANVFTPVVLPFLFLMLPIVSSVLVGLFLNYEYPLIQPGQLTWFQLPIWYALEIWYTIRQWKQALKEPWMSLRYWVGEHHFEVDIQVVKWTFLGSVNPDTGKVETAKSLEAVEPASGLTAQALSKVEMPGEDQMAGTLVYLLQARGIFPFFIATLTDVPERLFSSVGNIGNVIVGGLLFEVKQIAAASFNRINFTRTELVPFIPIGVFSDCAQIAKNIYESRKFVIPQTEALQLAQGKHDSHLASLYYRKWQDAEAIIANWEKESTNLDKRIDNRVGARIREARKAGQIPIGTSASTPTKLPGTRRQWVSALIVIGFIALIAALVIR